MLNNVIAAAVATPAAAVASRRCEGTSEALRLVVGVMSRPSNIAQRVAVRVTWGSATPDVILPCFLIGAQVKRTPRAPWDKRRPEEMAEPDGGPKGELSPNPAAAALAAEHASHGDVLVLAGSAEIHQGGTSGLKTITWWRHVAATMPNVVWVGKCDDDTLVNVPRLLARLPPIEKASPRALFGTIKWGCYSDQRLKWEPSWKTWGCGRTQFARSQAPGEPANLSKTYEGPCTLGTSPRCDGLPCSALRPRSPSWSTLRPPARAPVRLCGLRSCCRFADELALGWFFAMPRRLAVLLAHCKYANWFHERALHATREPFLRKEDDPLNGFWLYKCLREVCPCCRRLPRRPYLPKARSLPQSSLLLAMWRGRRASRQ